MSAIGVIQDLRGSLKLTASLTQSIKTLLLSYEELETYIDSEIKENPFLQREVHDDKVDYDLLRDYTYSRKPKTQYEDFDQIASIENEVTLKDHLYGQVSCIFNTEKDKIIAAYITDLLDENGYLTSTKEQIAKSLKVPEKKIKDILYRLKDLEPTGVYAENLAECIMLQLKEKGVYNEHYRIVLENIELIASRNIKKLAKIVGVAEQEIQNYISHIRSIDPKPGRNFSSEKIMYKIPDVFIRLNHLKEVEVISNDEAHPVIKVNKEYYENIKPLLKKSEDNIYAVQMMQSAQNVARAVKMRSKTIMLVASAIAKEQEEFFKRGVLYLKPLTLSQIAKVTGYDESTISRATSKKYAATPYGVFEMKYFFTSKVRSKYSQASVSSTKVKELIKTLIQEEDCSSPLSDDAIAVSLRSFNIVVARRTVTKYRESLGIKSSSERKKFRVK
ncbi:MAG: RNA polymerase factor sigma-54 [Rickettsiaceae bacterium]|nr:RNA polymerase factor sigma-54 [Rickettsiaceae bacterium]